MDFSVAIILLSFFVILLLSELVTVYLMRFFPYRESYWYRLISSFFFILSFFLAGVLVIVTIAVFDEFSSTEYLGLTLMILASTYILIRLFFLGTSRKITGKITEVRRSAEYIPYEMKLFYPIFSYTGADDVAYDSMAKIPWDRPHYQQGQSVPLRVSKLFNRWVVINHNYWFNLPHWIAYLSLLIGFLLIKYPNL